MGNVLNAQKIVKSVIIKNVRNVNKAISSIQKLIRANCVILAVCVALWISVSNVSMDFI